MKMKNKLEELVGRYGTPRGPKVALLQESRILNHGREASKPPTIPGYKEAYIFKCAMPAASG